jgi:PAS domain S-box-containing protein
MPVDSPDTEVRGCADSPDTEVRRYRSIGRDEVIQGRRRDGTEFAIEVAFSEVALPGRRLRTGIIRDVTERQAGEAALRESIAELQRARDALQLERDRLMGILHAMEDPVFIVDQHYNIQYGNPALHRHFGPSNGRKCHEYLHDRLEVCPDCPNPEVLAGRSLHWEWFSEKNGKHYELFDTPFRNPDGTVSKFELFHDVTQRKAGEAALRSTKELLERVFAAAHVSIACLDTEFRYLRVNRAFAEANGRPPEYYVGRGHFALFPSPEHEAIFRQVVQTGEPAVFHSRPFEPGKDSGRGVRFWDWSVNPVQSAGGAVEGLVLCLVDVTQRVRAEEQARARLAELAHVGRLGTMGEMAAGLAHELNQPLYAIVNYIQACFERIRAGARGCDLRADLERASQQAERAGAIIERIRHFVRKGESRSGAAARQAGAADGRAARADLNALVQEAVDLLRCELRQAGVQLTLSLSAGIPPVQAEGIQVEQVLVNLIRNGLEAMAEQPAGRRKLRIETDCRNGAAQVAIQDSGPGLDSTIADRIFEPFFTTKAQGMGMGLPISRTIIEAQGGRLWAGSGGGGARFHFTLPAGDAP